ncbi:hypothetical protein Aperf_G00000090631 [Anoplocephala perfoliata]
MRISHEIWYMSRAANDAKASRSQLLDMSLQLEARLNVMQNVIGQRETERFQLNALSKRLQDQLGNLQNPPNCKTAKFLTTILPQCGFGCQAHHAALAFQAAFARNRTLFIYGNQWFNIFLPITSCVVPGHNKIYQALLYNGIQLNYGAPPALRREWADALKDIHEFPYAWFRGQLLRYILLLRPSSFQRELQDDLKRTFPRPLIGIQVRRTDKLTKEAVLVNLSKYMEEVERINQRLQIEEELMPSGRTISRQIILASDDKQVFIEAGMDYPSYTFIGDYKKGSSGRKRGTKLGLQCIIYDVFTLANCDYVVCTFSSNICRLDLNRLEMVWGQNESRGICRYYLYDAWSTQSHLVGYWKHSWRRI